MPALNTFKIRRGTSSEWTNTSDILSAGELGYDTTLKKFKIGDGSTLWSSLVWVTILGTDLVGTSGINISYASNSGVATISVTGLSSSYISDFSSTVSGLLPVKNILPGTNIAVSNSGGTYTISTNGLDTNAVKDVIGSTISGVSGIRASYDNITKVETLSVTGLTSSYLSDFNSSVSGLINVKALSNGSGIGITSSGGTYTVSVTGIPSSFITDLGNIATTQVIGRTGVKLTYDSLTDSMYIDTTGVSLVGHSHVWSNITDASTRVTLGELTYLSGVTAGSASAGRALVLDSNKSITDINTITTTGNVTVGGDLVVQGTRTIVNSTTVEIGDNIIRVNTSGLNTGGMEVYTGTDTKSVVWNTSANRWEFTGGNIYTSGNFIGSLSGNASTVTNGVYTTDSGTVTNTMLAGSIANNKLTNSSVTIGSTSVSLGSSVTAFSGLSTVTATTFVGSLSGTADNVVTNANLTGPITSIGNATTISTGVIDNTHISPTGSISYSKLNLSNSLINSDVATDAAIVYSKLNLSSGIVNTDISSSASIAYSKLNLSNSLTNSDVSSSASIAYSKLNLTSGILNTDISASAAIAYSKLSLSNSIVNADVSSSAAIAYSKLNLTSGIVDSDISVSAAISINKLAYSGLTLGTTTLNLGSTILNLIGLSSISGTSLSSPVMLYNCVIDGGTP